MRLRGAFLGAIAAFACRIVALHAGEIYKSVDAEGHVVYSDRPGASNASQSSVELASTEPPADVEVPASAAPPPLPDDEQPLCPEDGYLWTPGSWAWNTAGYYWVPGAWVLPPRVGVLWTPGYWVFIDNRYVFRRGYWAAHVGYYGGINYGFGYFGTGFAGGHWVGRSFSYNTAVVRVDPRVTRSTYNETVARSTTLNKASYNGPGGTTSTITERERALAAETHTSATVVQRQNTVRAARTPTLMPPMSARVTEPPSGIDRPAAAVTHRPAVFNAPPQARSRNVEVRSPIVQNQIPRPTPNNRMAPRPAAPRPATVTRPHPPSMRLPAVGFLKP
ncbi:MAG TPA: DUF4124 domain-containing protein [Steroidobacteraceae bacterium]|jgi:hypothetical protein